MAKVEFGNTKADITLKGCDFLVFYISRKNNTRLPNIVYEPMFESDGATKLYLFSINIYNSYKSHSQNLTYKKYN